MGIRSAAFRTRDLAIALLLTATPAFAAQGVNLAWNHCLGEGTGVQNAVFACDTNSGQHTLVGSFVLGADMPSVSGMEIMVDLVAAAASLPAWWDYRNPGTCRQSSLTANFASDPANVVCADWSGGLAIGGIGAYCTGACTNAPHAARIKMVEAVPQQNLRQLTAGTEYFSWNVVIDHQKTVGTDSCSGCSIPVCIVFNSLNVTQSVGVGDRFISGGTGPGTDFATWQGGAVGGSGCPAATSTRRSTWGSVKSLYQ
jgi:hypothetical protein